MDRRDQPWTPPNLTVGQLILFAFISALGVVIGAAEMGPHRSTRDWVMGGLVMVAGILALLAMWRLRPPPDSQLGRLGAWLDDHAWMGIMAGGLGATLAGAGAGSAALLAGLPVTSVLGYFGAGFMGAATAKLAALRQS